MKHPWIKAIFPLSVALGPMILFYPTKDSFNDVVIEDVSSLHSDSSTKTGSALNNSHISKLEDIDSEAMNNVTTELVEYSSEHSTPAADKTTVKKVTRDNPLYSELMTKYQNQPGPLSHQGSIYFANFKNGSISHFSEITPETMEMLTHQPDDFIERMVEDFVADSEYGEWSDNWGDFESEAVDITYKYCRESSCVVRGFHSSVNIASEAVKSFKNNNPNLSVEEYILPSSGGSNFLLKYSKLD